MLSIATEKNYLPKAWDKCERSDKLVIFVKLLVTVTGDRLYGTGHLGQYDTNSPIWVGRGHPDHMVFWIFGMRRAIAKMAIQKYRMLSLNFHINSKFWNPYDKLNTP